MNPFTAKTIRSRKSNVETFASLTRRREAKIGTDRLLMSVPFFAYWKNSFFSFCFYHMQRDTCNCRAENGGPLTFNVVFISAQRKAGFAASWRESASLESRDAFLFVVSLAKKS